MQINSDIRSSKRNLWSSLTAYIVTAFRKNDKVRYRAILNGLLPEAIEQHKSSRESLNSLISTWSKASYTPEVENISNEEIKDISNLLSKAISMFNWKWAIIGGSTFLILISGILANQVVQAIIAPSPKQRQANEDCTVNLQCITLLDSAQVIDIDSGNFDEGQLTVSFIENTKTADDFLGIRSRSGSPGEILVRDDSVFYQNAEQDIEIGNFEVDDEGQSLIVLLNENVTQESASALLRSISYWNISQNPSLGDRKIEFQISDGDGEASRPIVQTVSVVSDSDSPIIQAPESLTVKSDSELTIENISVQDPDSQDITVVLSVSNGTLNVQNDIEDGLASVNIKNNNSGSVILEGTIDQINLTLSIQDSLKYRPNQGFSGEDFIVVTATDSGNTNLEQIEGSLIWPRSASQSKEIVKEIAIAVNPANAPTIALATVENLTVDEDQRLTFGSIEIIDPDSQIISVGFQVENGTLNITNDLPGNLNTETSFFNDLETLIVSGNIQQVKSFLSAPDALTYQGYQDFSGSDYINLIVYDGSYYGNFRTEITVEPINDAPIISANLPSLQLPNEEEVDVTNATIIGEIPPEFKNVRAGFSTDQEVLFELRVGSRVQILDSQKNSDDYLWYKIYSPDVEQEGWIASHLVRKD